MPNNNRDYFYMIKNDILKLIRFIVVTAIRNNFPGLWTIHIIKYLYLADYYNAKTEDKIITNLQWIFWNYGPWTSEICNVIQQAEKQGFILSKPTLSKKPSKDLNEENQYLLFYLELDVITDREYEKLGREVMPKVQARMALENIIRSYGCSTNPLLHHVYNRTEPMTRNVKKGDLLDFNNLSWPEQVKVEKETIKRKKVKKAKEILKRIKDLKKPEYYPPNGSYDSLYFKCVDILNEQDKLDIEDNIEVIASVKDVAI